MKAVLRGKIVGLSACIKKLQRSQTRNGTAHLKALDQKEANTHKRSRQKVEISKLEMKRIQRINETKGCFFEKINKIEKSLSKLAKRQRQYPN